MKSTPILFKLPMVQAIREGRKTQTRRIIDPQPIPDRHFPYGRLEWNPRNLHYTECNVAWRPLSNAFEDYIQNGHCPYGKPGDWMWGKETWRTVDSLDHVKPSNIRPGAPIEYAAGGNNVPGFEGQPLTGMGKWRPSIFMPKWMSRIILEVVSIRAQRLQDITEEDSIAEGCSPETRAEGTLFRGSIHPVKGTHKVFPCAKAAYRDIWESINGPGSWERNDYVFAVKFKEVKL